MVVSRVFAVWVCSVAIGNGLVAPSRRGGVTRRQSASGEIAAFEDPEPVDPVPASFGDSDGYWYTVGLLPGSDVYCRGKRESYHWHQNSELVQVLVPTSCSRREVEATVARRRLDVSAPVAFGGRLSHPIDLDTSYWYLEDGFLIFDLTKVDEFYNWADLFVDESSSSPPPPPP